MTKYDIKNKIFIFVIILALLETVFHAKSLIDGTQPSRINIFTSFLSLSPSILVYDRGQGYFSKLEITFNFENNAPPLRVNYREIPTDSGNYLEQIIKRKLQLSFNNKEKLNLLVQYFLCQNRIKSISEQIGSLATISSVSLNLKTKLKNAGYSEFNWSVNCLK